MARATVPLPAPEGPSMAMISGFIECGWDWLEHGGAGRKSIGLHVDLPYPT